MRTPLLAAAVALGCAWPTVPMAQEGGEAAKPAQEPRAILIAPPRHPQQARYFGARGIDIPQWAKDAGHNGSAAYLVSVGADGRAEGLELTRSSGSQAIDDAVRARLESAYISPATDAAGNNIPAQITVSLRYGQWDADSPGGGIEDYRCADLLQEYDWFLGANARDEDRLFPLQNAYVSLGMFEFRETNPGIGRTAIERQRDKFTRDWRDVVKRCRSEPDSLLLDQVEDPQGFRMLVSSVFI